MAKQKGLLQVRGTVGGMTFYQSQDGSLVKEKGGVSASKIATSPAFQRTRENGQEFGSAGRAGKTLRDAARPLMMNASDNRVTARLTGMMSQIQKLDTTSKRGERNVTTALNNNPFAKALLSDFAFNLNAPMTSILFKEHVVDVDTGKIDILKLIPVNDISIPKGATHVSFQGAFAKVDFEAGTSETKLSSVIKLALDTTESNVSLIPASVPTGNGVAFYLLQVQFLQEVNGFSYPLKSDSFNSLSIVKIG